MLIATENMGSCVPRFQRWVHAERNTAGQPKLTDWMIDIVKCGQRCHLRAKIEVLDDRRCKRDESSTARGPRGTLRIRTLVGDAGYLLRLEPVAAPTIAFEIGAPPLCAFVVGIGVVRIRVVSLNPIRTPFIQDFCLGPQFCPKFIYSEKCTLVPFSLSY